MILNAPLFATVLPGIFGIIIYSARRYTGKITGLIATIVAAASFFLILSMTNPVVDVYNNGGYPFILVYPWLGAMDINFSFLIDMISFPIGLTIALISTLSCLYSVKYMEKEAHQASYYANLLIFMTGMIGVIFSSNLIQFYIFWELTLIPSYLLIVQMSRSAKRLSVGFRYFIFTHMGALSMLLGMLYVYSYAHTFDLVALPSKSSSIPATMTTVIFVLLLLGFLVKIAAFPLHTWLPDAYSEAPMPVAAMLSGAMANCGAYGFVRIIFPILSQSMAQASDYLLIISIATILYGGLIAFSQADIVRMLAYSSISQMGYIIFGFGTVSPLGIMGSLLHIVSHAFAKSLLFLCAGSMIRQTGTRNMRRMSGLMSRMPVTGFAFLIGALSLAGIPPLNAFWSEWMIFAGGLASGKTALTFVGVAASMITPIYFLWFSLKVLFGIPRKGLQAVEAPMPLLFPIVILTSICIILGIWPGLMLQFITPAARLFSLIPP